MTESGQLQLSRSPRFATHLEHEVGDHAVEAGGSVAVTVLSGAELAEVALGGKDFSLGIAQRRESKTNGSLGDDVIVLG